MSDPDTQAAGQERPGQESPGQHRSGRDRAGAPPPVGSAPWHALAPDRVLDTLGTTGDGLTADDASERLARYGPNQLRARERTPAWRRLLAQFHNPLIYVLLATAVVTAILGHWVDTGVIVGVVVINAIVGFIQEARAEQAIESLRRMLAPVALAVRDGRRVSVPAAELVPGDVVVLQGGDKVPADLRLLHARNLQVDEAALTGESLPVAKETGVLEESAALADRRDMAYAGTLATTGAGTGVVTGTGSGTEIGRIAAMLEDVHRVDTPLIRQLASFSKTITAVILALCVAVFVAGVLTGREPLEMLMAAVALAVSAIPEGLPAIMTIALAIGVKRMAQRNAVVRKLPAVEALGSVTVICTDKTGTLTRNEMTVTRIVTPAGSLPVDSAPVDSRQADSRQADSFSVTGAGYAPHGEILDAGGNPACVPEQSPLHELLRAGVLCNESVLAQREGGWEIEGDPTEASLLVLAGKAGLDRAGLSRGWPRTDLIPFESEQQCMATLHHDHEGRERVLLKGAPEKVIDACAGAWGGTGPIDRTRWHEHAHEMATGGLRVLAIAAKPVDPPQSRLSYDDLRDGFELLGLVGIMDPPREDALVAIRECKAAGIGVKMITGDHVATARTIAAQLGIGDGQRALSGADLDQLDEVALGEAVARIDVFARVSPAHKLRLVQALQADGQIVSMTGDGVNDAPALRQADIGVAMGVNGTDVSKEAAEMVLLDDNFVSIQRAVVEGRTVYNNLEKTIAFILPTNGGECLTLIVALALAVTLPILPLHILWINLVTTVALAITLAFDPIDDDAMTRPPRDPRAALIGPVLVWRIVEVSILMTAATFGLFFYELESGQSLEVARSVAVNTIVFCEVAYVLNSRHLSRSVLNRRAMTANPVLWWGVAAVVAFQVAFTYSPVMNELFRVAPLDGAMWARVLGAAVALLLLVEVEKVVSGRFARAGR